MSYWYNISAFPGHTTAQILELLEPIGVQLRPPAGRAHYFKDEDGRVMKMVGRLVVTAGAVKAIPRHNVRDVELRCLLGSAEEAFRVKPSKQTNWTLHRTGGATWWDSDVLFRLRPDADDEVASLVARHERAGHVTAEIQATLNET